MICQTVSIVMCTIRVCKQSMSFTPHDTVAPEQMPKLQLWLRIDNARVYAVHSEPGSMN